MTESFTPNTETAPKKEEEVAATPTSSTILSQVKSTSSTILSQVKSYEPTLELPDGIEHHFEAYAKKSVLGFTFGAASGILLFRTNKGRNALAGGLFGIGAATGSFIERVVGDGDPAIPSFDSFDLPDISKWTKKD